MPVVADLGPGELTSRLAGPGLGLSVVPFAVRVCSRLPGLVDGIRQLYGDYQLLDVSDRFFDFHIELAPGEGLRRHFGAAQSRFLLDGVSLFKPLPAAQAYPSFEWGLNWCIANHAHQYLLLHAGVVERNGQVAILPAPPGSGKSTLTAALICRGWRLFSDEMALVRLEDLRVDPVPRPVCLKNESIAVLREFEPSIAWGPVVRETRKGMICHVRTPVAHVRRANERGDPAWIVFPRYKSGVALQVDAVPKAQAASDMVGQAFNFGVLGDHGFQTLVGLAESCAAYDLTYSNLDDAIGFFERLAAGDA